MTCFFSLPDMAKVYIAGPMSGYPEFNFPAFDEMAVRLARHDFTPVNPAALDRAADDNSPEAIARRDVNALLDAAAVVVLEGWEGSVGATNEVMVARWLGIPVYNHEWQELNTSTVPFSGAGRDEELERLLDEEEALAREAWIAGGGEWIPLKDEVRVVDPTTGGAKGQKPQRLELLPYDTLAWVAEHYAKGASKYSDRNWEKGYAWSLTMGALMRHLAAWWQGEEDDAETGSNHLQAVVFHALALATFVNRNIGTDDRPAFTPSEQG